MSQPKHGWEGWLLVLGVLLMLAGAGLIARRRRSAHSGPAL